MRINVLLQILMHFKQILNHSLNFNYLILHTEKRHYSVRIHFFLWILIHLWLLEFNVLIPITMHEYISITFVIYACTLLLDVHNKDKYKI